MALPSPKPSTMDSTDQKLKIYFLPNLLTAGNLFCGFVALTKIVEANLAEVFLQIKYALAFILLACIFDLFDGRVARMGGVESPFGREFDSLADLISFGAAPAFLVHRVVLHDVFVEHPERRLVHRLDLFVVRGVSAGAVQLPGGPGWRREQGLPRISDTIGRGSRSVAYAFDHQAQRERESPGQMGEYCCW